MTSHDAVFFTIRGRRCAMPTSRVREVVGLPPVTPVPLAPPALRGVVPLRGQGLPLIDLGALILSFQGGRNEPLPPRPSNTGAALVVEAALGAEPAPVRAAFLVDEVREVIPVDEHQVRGAPPELPFLTGTVLLAEGPAWLVDASATISTIVRLCNQIKERARA